MNICMISKYPPIEGGVSSATYWLAKALGARGHKIHVVTNANQVEPEYHEIFDPKDPNYAPKNVHVHSTDPSVNIEANPCHIPFSKMYCEKLASMAIQVIDEYNIDVIDSGYLAPYCVAGYLAKSFTGVPLIVRHAGSDLQRLFPSPYLKPLLTKVVQNADKIITNPDRLTFFQNLTIPKTKIITFQNIPVDQKAFNPQVKPLDLTTKIANKNYCAETHLIAYIGKITYHYQTKGLLDLLGACSKIKQNFLLLFVANGNKLTEFKNQIKQYNLTEKTAFLNFVPPWQIPDILKSCTCIVSLENECSPTLDYSVSQIPAEAMATGKCVLMSKKTHSKQPYRKFVDGTEVLVVNPQDTNLRKKLETLIKSPSLAETIGFNAHDAVIKKDHFDNYVEKIINIYKELS